MKLFCIFLIIVLSSTSNAVISNEKRRELMIQSITECRTKENGTDEDLSHIIATMHAETHSQRCMIACGLEDFAVVSWFRFQSFSVGEFDIFSIQTGDSTVKRFCMSQR
jgi:hypothetical protein